MTPSTCCKLSYNILYNLCLASWRWWNFEIKKKQRFVKLNIICLSFFLPYLTTFQEYTWEGPDSLISAWSLNIMPSCRKGMLEYSCSHTLFYPVINSTSGTITSCYCRKMHFFHTGNRTLTPYFAYICASTTCISPSICPLCIKYIRQTLWKEGLSLSSWSIWLVPGAPSSIEVSIWKYHCDPDINQWAPRGGGRGGGGREGGSWGA